MSTNEKIDELGKLVREIHQSVLIIENEHGQKLEALFDGLDSVNNRLESMGKRLGNVEVDVTEIKNGFSLGMVRTVLPVCESYSASPAH